MPARPAVSITTAARRHGRRGAEARRRAGDPRRLAGGLARRRARPRRASRSTGRSTARGDSPQVERRRDRAREAAAGRGRGQIHGPSPSGDSSGPRGAAAAPGARGRAGPRRSARAPRQHLARVEQARRDRTRGAPRPSPPGRAASNDRPMKSRFSMPMPCSPERLPPSATHASQDLLRGLPGARDAVRVVGVVAARCGCRLPSPAWNTLRDLQAVLRRDAAMRVERLGQLRARHDAVDDVEAAGDAAHGAERALARLPQQQRARRRPSPRAPSARRRPCRCAWISAARRSMPAAARRARPAARRRRRAAAPGARTARPRRS